MTKYGLTELTIIIGAYGFLKALSFIAVLMVGGV